MKKLLTLLVLVLATTFTLSSFDSAVDITTPKHEVKPLGDDKGKAVFDKTCYVCHKTGVAGAAATEGDNFDKKRWEVMAKKGLATLKKHAIAGFTGDYGAMPAKGTCMDCSDADIEAAIKYMFKKVDVAVK